MIKLNILYVMNSLNVSTALLIKLISNYTHFFGTYEFFIRFGKSEIFKWRWALVTILYLLNHFCRNESSSQIRKFENILDRLQFHDCHHTSSLKYFCFLELKQNFLCWLHECAFFIGFLIAFANGIGFGLLISLFVFYIIFID